MRGPPEAPEGENMTENIMRIPFDRSMSVSTSERFARGPEAFLLTLIAAICLRAFSFSTTGLDWDESFYIVVAQRWLHGDIPYAAIWDIHPMGVPALFALGTWLFGDGLLAARILGLLAVAGTATVLWVFLDRYTRQQPAGILAALFYLLSMSRPEGLASNTEVFNNFAVSAASFLLAGQLLAPREPTQPGRIFAAALLLGVGLQLKYVVFPEAVMLCGTVLIWRLREGASFRQTAGLAALAVAGGILPTVLASLYYWWAGALQPYLDATLRANVAYIEVPLTMTTVLQRLRFGLLPIAGLLIWPIVLFAPALRRDRGRHARLICLWLAVWLLAAWIDVVMPLKFWKHYFNALVPPLCLIAALAITWLARTRPAWFARTLTAGVVLTIVPAVAEMSKHVADSRSIDRPNTPLEISRRITEAGTNGHDVYVFNYDPLVYAYTGAKPPSRFVLGVELSDFSSSAGTSGEAEIGRVLNGDPRWIVIARPSPYTYPEAIWWRLDTTLRNYRLDSTFREEDYIQPPIEVSLYRRRDAPGAK
jgi:4-amino-4-deoxy-L-arabinose transferase-like glycosyltransferase